MSKAKSTKPTFHTITDEERKRLSNQLKGKPITIRTDETLKLLRNLFRNWASTDIGFSCIHDTLQLSVYNDAEMRGQMLLWKDLAKQGKIGVLECNNYTNQVHDKEIHFLTITPRNNTAMIDPIGIATGHMVNGYIYGFRRKTNRDAVFNYVKKFQSIYFEMLNDGAVEVSDDEDEKE